MDGSIESTRAFSFYTGHSMDRLGGNMCSEGFSR